MNTNPHVIRYHREREDKRRLDIAQREYDGRWVLWRKEGRRVRPYWNDVRFVRTGWTALSVHDTSKEARKALRAELGIHEDNSE